MKSIYILFFLISNLLVVSIHSDPKQKKIMIGSFSTSERNSKITPYISQKLQTKLENSGYEVILLDKTTSRKSGFRRAQSENAFLFVSGSFAKNPTTNNLDIYGQIYNPQNKTAIDAYSKTDQELSNLSIKLDSEELKETDDKRMEEFVDKLVLQIRSNPDKKERRNNIQQHILLAGLEKKYYIPLRSAKEASKQSQSDVFNLIQEQQQQVTISATKTAKKINEAPNIVSVLGYQENIEYGRISINDILYSLPGFAPSKDYDRRTVSSRGMFEGWNNNHLLLLMDGVQFNDSLYGTAYTWEIMPLNMVKSIEVIRGPGSALYGANATNGVISLNTFSGEDLKGELRTRVRAGDSGTRIYDILYGNRSDYASYVVSYNKYQTDGNEYLSEDGSERVDDFGYYKKFTVNDTRENQYAFAKVEGVGFLKGLSMQLHHQQWQFETGHGWLWRIPDLKENMSESLDTISLRYQNDIGDKFSHEYVVRYQEHSVDWHTRYGERDSYEAYYPSGIWEYLNSQANELSGRAQFAYNFSNDGSFLLGVEVARFLYDGDDGHFSNIGLADAVNGYPPYENGIFLEQGPWFEWIQSQPIPKGGIFAQLISGKLLDKMVELTLGVRYDQKVANFKGIDEPYSEFLPFPYYPDEQRIFRRTSPRIGLVFFAMDSLTFKLMAGTAFREPAITELFGANTFTLASDPRNLKPEIITTRELAMDYFFNRYINLRVNVFQTVFENQIAYSTANNNLSTNIYNLHTQGLESELLVNYRNWQGFLNYSYNRRINEHILDTTVSRSHNLVTWTPKTTANLGLRGHFRKWIGSLSIHRQGKVYRRISDLGSIDPLTGLLTTYSEELLPYRPKIVPAWTDVDTRIMYAIHKNWQFGLSIYNLFNDHQTLIKNNYYPFDYIREGRRYLVELQASF